MTETLDVTTHGSVMVMTLNRPAARNSFNGELSLALAEAVRAFDEDPSVNSGVITGAGGYFSAGMDLKAHNRGEDITPLSDFVKRGARKPLIAAVEGFALAGGLETALTCDLIVSADNAIFGIPEVTVGLVAAAGGVLRLPARVGHSRAMAMALTGEPLSADEAHRYGLVHSLTAPGEALEKALALAERIAANAPTAVEASKLLVKATAGTTEADFWALQTPIIDVVLSSPDSFEGPAAFAEKRAPQWSPALPLG